MWHILCFYGCIPFKPNYSLTYRRVFITRNVSTRCIYSVFTPFPSKQSVPWPLREHPTHTPHGQLSLKLPGDQGSTSQAASSDMPPRKKIKTTAYKGSARYSTKFSRNWSRSYGCTKAMHEHASIFFPLHCL